MSTPQSGTDRQSATARGRLIVVVVAVTLATVGIATANGTVLPAVLAGAGIGLLARLAWVMTLEKEHQQP